MAGKTPNAAWSGRKGCYAAPTGLRLFLHLTWGCVRRWRTPPQAILFCAFGARLYLCKALFGARLYMGQGVVWRRTLWSPRRCLAQDSLFVQGAVWRRALWSPRRCLAQGFLFGQGAFGARLYLCKVLFGAGLCGVKGAVWRKALFRQGAVRGNSIRPKALFDAGLYLRKA
jgi:hypothetical protein